MITFRHCLNELSPYVPGRPMDDVKKEFHLDTVVKLASNENPFGCSEKVTAAVLEALESAQLYPDGNCTMLRAALAEKYEVKPENIVFGCGTDELLTLLGKILISPMDECITAEVSFSQYTASVKAMDGVMVYSKMKNHGFDLDDILTKITPKTKLIFISNPNNPTGTAFFQKEQEAFLEKVPANVVVVFDEAYAEFVQEDQFPHTLALMKKYKNVILFKTFSKAYGLAALRVGFGIASEEIIRSFEKMRNPFNVSTIAQVAALAVLSDEAFVHKTVQNNAQVLQWLYKELDTMGLSYIPTYTNFIMIDTKKDSRVLFTELMQKGYIIRPGSAFGMDTWLRVTIGTAAEMEGFIGALKDIFAEK